METATHKREGYISWDEYFMGVALLAAERSKDPNTRVGACIVDGDNRILSTGYNGFPAGCSDEIFPWNRDADKGETKYPFVVHAELNAILNTRGRSLYGSKLYVALFPCNECAKAIIQAGVREVIYLSDKYHDSPSCAQSRRMLDAAGVLCRKLKTSRRSIVSENTLYKPSFFRSSGGVSNCRKSLNDFNCTSRKSGNGIGFLTLPKFTLLSMIFEAINFNLLILNS